MRQITFGKKIIEYSVKKSSRRKTLTISITPASQVVVLAPQFLNEDKIGSIVKNKTRWILEKQHYFRKLYEQYPEKEFVSGEQILFLGRRYRLKLKNGKADPGRYPVLSGRRILVFVDSRDNSENRKKQIKNTLRNWLVDNAGKVISQRIKRYAGILGVNPAGVKIKEPKKQWGSCSRSGVLRFNWRIAMAPVSIIDYVVIHELSHLKVKNHSADFWRQVSLILPDFQARRNWLKNHSAALRI